LEQQGPKYIFGVFTVQNIKEELNIPMEKMRAKNKESRE
jgi:hypothetical protein